MYNHLMYNRDFKKEKSNKLKFKVLVQRKDKKII